VKSEIEVPEGWSTSRLEDLCEILDSKRIPITKSKREPGDVPYYGATGILDYVKGYIFDEELVLVGEDGADWSAFAKTAYIVRGKSWVNNHAHVLRCKGINSVFFKEYLNMTDLGSYITGTTRGKLNQESMRKIKLFYPPLPEQQKITDILSKVDEQIQQTEKIIDKTEELKKGLMQKLLTRGIGHTRFKQTDLGDIPEEWNMKTTKETLYIKGRIGWRGLKKAEFTKSGPYLITGIHFIDGKIDWDNCFHITMERYIESPEIQVKENDVLITKDGTIGKVAFIDYLPDSASLNSHLLVLRPLDDSIYPEYLYYVLLSNLFKKHIESIKTGSTLSGLSQSNFEKFKFFIPSISEQKQIASILSKVDGQIKDNKSQLEKFKNLKKGLMQDLLTGRVRVTV